MLMGVYILVFILSSSIYCEKTEAKKRQKRYLLFTTGSQYGVYGTVSVPLEMDSYISVAWFYEASYYNVDNSTWFEPLLGDIPTSRREHRSVGASKGLVTRKSLYVFVESMLDSNGYPGRACMLRAICENADAHFLHNGLMGDLLYFILTRGEELEINYDSQCRLYNVQQNGVIKYMDRYIRPSTSMAEDDIEDCFYEAEYYGLDKDCVGYNEECPFNPLEHITIYAGKTSIPNNIL